jgi:hypothetical protein
MYALVKPGLTFPKKLSFYASDGLPTQEVSVQVALLLHD